MTGDSQVNRKGNEMALCMVQREASKVNNNNRIPTSESGLHKGARAASGAGASRKSLGRAIVRRPPAAMCRQTECAGGNGKEIEEHRSEHRRGRCWLDEAGVLSGDIVSKTAVVKLVAEDRTLVDCSRRPAA